MNSNGQGKVFSNLGRDLMNSGTLDSRFHTAFGAQGFQNKI